MVRSSLYDPIVAAGLRPNVRFNLFDGAPRMYANILLSTDGSDVARKGVEHGLALARP
jgi:hypothetical protein